MDRQATEFLAQFCIAQRSAFDADEWFLRSETDGKAVALAARFLSMTSWYGHDDALVEIAAKITPALDGGTGLYAESQAAGFDWPYFSTTVRIGITLRQVRQASATTHPSGHPTRLQGDLFEERSEFRA